MTPTINAYSAAIKLLRDAGCAPLGMIVPSATFAKLQWESGALGIHPKPSIKAKEIVVDGIRIRESRVA